MSRTLIIINYGIFESLPVDLLYYEELSKQVPITNIQYNLANYTYLKGDEHCASIANVHVYSFESELTPLISGGKESQDVYETWKQELDVNIFTSISSDDFISSASQADLLHIVGHASYDLNDYQKSHISLSDSVDIDYEDLGALALDAKLVVLSACETSLGQHFPGEGACTFPYKFISKGAKSVVATQWAVNDSSSAMIMDHFHKNLKSGQSKSLSLKNAKEAYLAEVDPEYWHPYYWSGFMIIGSDLGSV